MSDSITAWLDEPRSADELKRRHQPIKLLGTVLKRSLQRVGDELKDLPADDTAFERCKNLDAQLTVVEKLWRFYRERLDQRSVPEWQGVLAAADELIWSCFCALGGEDAATVPLPFVDSAHSPVAIPRAQPPTGLSSTDKLLADLLRGLPLPVISVPSDIIESPWWLVLLAHEVGHHVQYDLEAESALVGKTGDALAAIADDPAVTKKWIGWRFELFADACSVVIVGASAIRAIAELEWNTLDAMCIDRHQYPSTVVRLSVMCELATLLGLPAPDFGPSRWQPDLDKITNAARRNAVADDLQRAPAVAKALAGLQVGPKTLRERFDATLFSDIDNIRQRLQGTGLLIKSGRRTARLIGAAAFELYQEGAGVETLDDAMLALIASTCDGSSRAGANAALIDRCSALIEKELVQMRPEPQESES